MSPWNCLGVYKSLKLYPSNLWFVSNCKNEVTHLVYLSCSVVQRLEQQWVHNSIDKSKNLWGMSQITQCDQWWRSSNSLKQCQHDVLHCDTRKVAIESFCMLDNKVSHTWRPCHAPLEERHLITDISSDKVGNVGRKKRIVKLDCMWQLPLEWWSSIQSLSIATNILKSTLHYRLKA